MILRGLAAGAMLLVTGACGLLAPGSTDTPAGQYMLRECWAADGVLGCPEADSVGTVITVVGGQLYVGPPRNPDGRYDWYLTHRYENLDGTENLATSLISAGAYRSHETTLALVDDSSDIAPITGTFNGFLTLLTRGRRYEFDRLVLLPPGGM